MKKFTLTILVLITTITISWGQAGLRIYNYRPTGNYGAFFKPTISAELGYIEPFSEVDNKLRMIGTLTFMNMKPRMEEFPITGEKESGGVTTIYPGTQSFKTFLQFQGHGGFDFAFVKKKKFCAFAGTNLLLGWAFMHYRAVNGIRDEEGYVSGQEIGFQLRLGTEYQLNDRLALLLSANRSYFRMWSEDIPGNYWSNDYGIGIIYNLKN